MQIDKDAALRHLESFGLPFGGQGPGTLKYWNTLDGYLADYTLTWDEVPHAKQTWENGAKKRGYNFTRSYRRPDPRPENGGVDYPEEDPPKTHRVPFWRKWFMADEHSGPAPATFPADEATQELWDLNKKIVLSDELENARRGRQQYDDRVGDVRVNMQQLQNVALQALQNAVESANMLGKQSLRHSELAAATQWRDQTRDNYPADEMFDLGNADDETD